MLHFFAMSMCMPSDPPVDADPRPEPPATPDAAECCGNGCDPCIYDLHAEAMAYYREALAAWRERHPDQV